jgi:peptide/nickel transport system substrate-binding protein
VQLPLLVAVALALALGSNAGLAAASTVRLTIGVVGPVGSLDITTGTGDVAREVWRLQYPTLTALTADTLSPTPGLADAWSPSADGQTWTYTLRPGLAWSDEQPVTAADVVYSLNRARDEHWPYAGTTFDDLTAAAVDDRTVSVTAGGDPGALPTLLLHVVPQHVFERGTDVDDAGAVGAGDWNVVERTDDEVRMAVRERPGRPRLDEIVFRSHEDSDALVDAIDRGRIDVAAGIDAGDYEQVRGLDGVTAIHASDGDQWILRVTPQSPPAVHVPVLGQAIDRVQLVADVAGGVGRAMEIPVVARDTTWQLPKSEAERLAGQVDYAPARARRAIEQLGGTPRVTLAEPRDRIEARIADFVERSLTDAGMDVERVAGAAAELTVVRRDPSDDPGPALRPYACTTGCDAEFQQQYERYMATRDTTTRVDAVHEMTRRLVAQGEVVLFAPDELQAFRTDNVTGLLREPDDVRLVVFWPSVQAYQEVVPTSVPGGEDIPTSAFVLIALVVVGATAAALVVAARVRSPHN